MAETMGAIHVKINLVNVFDKRMVEKGSLAPRHLRQFEGTALIDTGALTISIPSNVAEELGLQVERHQPVRYANGYEETIPVSEPIFIEIEGRSTVDEALIVGDEILIGQVILEKLDFMADCKNQRLVPNHPDYPIAMLKGFQHELSILR